MSLILSGNSTSTSTEKKASVEFTKWSGHRVRESSFMESFPASFPTVGPFSGAVFYGGHFKITIKHSQQVTNFYLSLNTGYT